MPVSSAGSDATSIQGIPVNATAPILGQALVYDGSEYVPTTIALDTPTVYACPAGVAVRDAVYLSGTLAVDKADATDRAKMPAVGFVVQKPTATTCILQDRGELSGFVGLTPQARYFFSTGGAISTSAPTPNGASVEQQAGFAVSATILDIELGTSPEMDV